MYGWSPTAGRAKNSVASFYCRSKQRDVSAATQNRLTQNLVPICIKPYGHHIQLSRF
jgi:hypothetical protein